MSELEKEELPDHVEKVRLNVCMSVKLDYELLRMLGIIALFEHKKPSTLARDIVTEKVQVYERNPAFKRFLKDYQAKKQKEREKEIS